MGILAALARLPSNFTRHGEQTCASSYSVPLITRHGELGASWGRANVPLCLFFSDATRHCELGASWGRANVPLCLFLALLCLFLVFLLCSVP